PTRRIIMHATHATVAHVHTFDEGVVEGAAALNYSSAHAAGCMRPSAECHLRRSRRCGRCVPQSLRPLKLGVCPLLLSAAYGVRPRSRRYQRQSAGWAVTRAPLYHDTCRRPSYPRASSARYKRVQARPCACSRESFRCIDVVEPLLGGLGWL